MAGKDGDPTPGQVVQKLKEWWMPIGFIITVVTGAVIAWNSRASASDLDTVKKLLTEQDKKTERLDGKLASIDHLFDDVLQLRARIEVIADRLPKPPPAPLPTPLPAAVPSAGQNSGQGSAL
jgi:hypothetical protein